VFIDDKIQVLGGNQSAQISRQDRRYRVRDCFRTCVPREPARGAPDGRQGD
jgi:hypothetical protein